MKVCAGRCTRECFSLVVQLYSVRLQRPEIELLNSRTRLSMHAMANSYSSERVAAPARGPLGRIKLFKQLSARPVLWIQCRNFQYSTGLLL